MKLKISVENRIHHFHHIRVSWVWSEKWTRRPDILEQFRVRVAWRVESYVVAIFQAAVRFSLTVQFPGKVSGWRRDGTGPFCWLEGGAWLIPAGGNGQESQWHLSMSLGISRMAEFTWSFWPWARSLHSTRTGRNQVVRRRRGGEEEQFIIKQNRLYNQ